MTPSNITPPKVTLKASPPRRIFAVLTLSLLALTLGALAQEAGGTPLSALALFVLAGLAAWFAWRLWRATQGALHLTQEGLATETGEIIAPFARIASVDRGAFAFKPSSGFLLRLDRPLGPRLWAPGLYWRFGRRLGVGGVTQSPQAKAMAEEIALRIEAYDES